MKEKLNQKLAQGGFFSSGSPRFLVKRLRIFDICDMFARTREVSQCGHFADKGRGSIFHDFARIYFMDGFLKNF